MPKKKIDRWKNWQPPEKLWWKTNDTDETTKARREEIARTCREEKDGMALAKIIALKVAQRAFRYRDNPQAIQDIADHIVGFGYCHALRSYKPGKGAQFKTFLYLVLLTEARYWARKFKKKNMLFAKCHLTVEIRGNVGGYSQGVFLEDGIATRGYSIPNFDLFICKTPPSSENGKVKPFIENNRHDVVKEQCLTFDRMTMRETIELLHQARNIKDDEFQAIQRRYLPAMYRKMTDAKLRSALAALDVRILKLAMSFHCKGGYTKTTIQKTLGIKRDFLHARFMAILKRLDIPHESAIRWYGNHKIYKKKRERKKRTGIQLPENENPKE